MEFVFLCLGLGFFLYIVHLCERDENKRYDRQLNEKREFGYQKVKDQLRKDLRKL